VAIANPEMPAERGVWSESTSSSSVDEVIASYPSAAPAVVGARTAISLSMSETADAILDDMKKIVSQARKYGLGLIFATQVPKGLHNQIPGNAATQIFGLLNAPVHIEAAREMARFRGGDVPDISRPPPVSSTWRSKTTNSAKSAHRSA
jgi:hypothetical protein